MADFNFYLNRQGAQGRKGDKGDAGFSPNISVSEQTLESYKLKIVNEYNEFETPNLLGNLNIVDNGGTYLRYDKDTETISAGEIDGATSKTVGGVRKASTEDLSNLSADSVVTPANVADMLPLMLEAGTNNVTIEQDEKTSKTKISVSADSSEIIEIKADINTIKGDVSVLENRASEDEKDISNLKTSKQDVLTAGGGIKIEDNIISTTGGSGTGDVTAAGNNTFTGENTFTSTNNFNGTINLNGITNLNGVNTATNLVVQRTLTSSGEIDAVLINATGIRSDDIQTTTGKKYLNESNLDGQTISMVDGKVHVNMDELGNEVNDLSGRVTAAEADITTLQTDVTDINGDLDKKQAKLTAGNNITLTDLTDGTVRIDATGGGGTGDIPIATTTTAGKVKPDGTTITITDDGTISAVGGSGGGATIDDNTTTTTSVWSSSKTNAEITTVANEVVQVQGDVASLDGDVSTLKTDVTGLKTDVSGLKTSKQNTLVSGTNIKTINGETILGEGDITVGGSTPANMVTTDTIQDITGVKTFKTLKIKELNTIGSAEIFANHGLIVTNNQEDVITLRNTSYLETRHGAYASAAIMRFGKYDNSSSAQIISSHTNGSGSYGNLILEANSGTSNESRLKLTKNSLTFTTSDGTVTNLLSGGSGSAPDNMVTTDTSQTISANKTFTGEIRIGDDSGYKTLARFSKESLVDGDSTLLEYVTLGEATFVVEGNLGKKVYETDKYVYKKYINVDDLSDNTRQYNNTISSQVAHMAMPSNKYINLTLGASGTTYTAPADGWFCFVGKANAANQYIHILDNTTSIEVAFNLPVSGQTGKAFIPSKKGDSIKLNYNTGSDKSFKFIYSVGSSPTL